MHSRCENPKFCEYPRYGARGIYVCWEWNKFEPFYAWVKTIYPDGNVPRGMTIERKDNLGPYSPENCYFATKKQQAENTRRNHLVTFQDKTQTLSQWAEQLDIQAPTIRHRLKAGWTVEKALTVAP